ncbi:hypothetical protein [Bacillus sp. CECT 9360]|nr:hypothetical protein [Bacillus sp. CECT 9360]CAH0346084.1 hypothetical protein BCI9360_02402 [Bacillus sp. CECT 9360]
MQEEVFYNGTPYIVIYKYDSGFWEIQKKQNGILDQIILVHMDQVES